VDNSVAASFPPLHGIAPQRVHVYLRGTEL
jgi:hypothetical protein